MLDFINALTTCVVKISQTRNGPLVLVLVIILVYLLG